eukprot:1502140-Prymnesium_polylepis.1
MAPGNFPTPPSRVSVAARRSSRTTARTSAGSARASSAAIAEPSMRWASMASSAPPTRPSRSEPPSPPPSSVASCPPPSALALPAWSTLAS